MTTPPEKLSPTFSIPIPDDVATFQSATKRGIMGNTPNMAEIIILIATHEDFRADAAETIRLITIARKIASRYSGHPHN